MKNVAGGCGENYSFKRISDRGVRHGKKIYLSQLFLF